MWNITKILRIHENIIFCSFLGFSWFLRFLGFGGPRGCPGGPKWNHRHSQAIRLSAKHHNYLQRPSGFPATAENGFPRLTFPRLTFRDLFCLPCLTSWFTLWGAPDPRKSWRSKWISATYFPRFIFRDLFPRAACRLVGGYVRQTDNSFENLLDKWRIC